MSGWSDLAQALQTLVDVLTLQADGGEGEGAQLLCDAAWTVARQWSDCARVGEGGCVREWAEGLREAGRRVAEAGRAIARARAELQQARQSRSDGESLVGVGDVSGRC